MKIVGRVGLLLSVLLLISLGDVEGAGPRDAVGLAPGPGTGRVQRHHYVGDLSLVPLASSARAELASSVVDPDSARLPDGTCTASLAIYDARVGGTQLGQTIEVPDVQVVHGMFALELDVAETDIESWLEVSVKHSSGRTFLLGDREPLPTMASGAEPLLGTDAFVGGGLNNQADGNYAVATGGLNNNAFGNKSAITGGRGNEATGLAAVIAGGELNEASLYWPAVGGGRENRATDSYAVIAGGYGNKAQGPKTVIGGGRLNLTRGIAATVSGGQQNKALRDYAAVGGGRFNQVRAKYGTIAGGGADSLVDGNLVTDKYGAVGGGFNNMAGNAAGSETDAWLATVGGGAANTASGSWSTVGGGVVNIASGSGSTVSGGDRNNATATGAFVGGGYGNNAVGERSAVSGGYENRARGYRAVVGGGHLNNAYGYRAAIGGGYSNYASGRDSAIAGGYDNLASGVRGTVPGGYKCAAVGSDSFAAGYRAKANHNGSFVWSDNRYASDIGSHIQHSARFRAYNGLRVDSGVWWLEIGHAKPIESHTGAYLGTDGVWHNSSDAARKTGFEDVDAQVILEKVAGLRIQTWQHRREVLVKEEGAELATAGARRRHLGPTSQDFFATFGLGGDDKTISTLDADGVALKSIQALYARVLELEAKVAELEVQAQTR